MAIEITGLPQAVTTSIPKDNGQAGTNKSDANQTNSSGNSRSPIIDGVTITREAQNLYKMEIDISTQSEIDANRVANLKMEIDSGRYNIDSSRVAEKFLQFETQLAV